MYMQKVFLCLAVTLFSKNKINNSSDDADILLVEQYSHALHMALVWVWGSPGLIVICPHLYGHIVIGLGPPCTHTKIPI